MISDPVRQIIEQAAQAKQQHMQDRATIHNFADLRSQVLMTELGHEIDFLKTLDTAEMSDKMLASAIKQRMAERSTNPGHCVSFADDPFTPTNQLYWEVLKTIRGATKLHEMLAEVSPETQSVIVISLPKEKPKEMTLLQYRKAVEPEMKKSDIETLDGEASLDELRHYVCAGELAMDTRPIENYHLQLHEKVQTMLSVYHPELQQELKRHNAKMAEVEEDSKLSRESISPREAINTLIRKLNQGGERMTGATFASPEAQDHYDKVFFPYWQGLDPTDREQLEALSEGKSLGRVLSDLSHGRCVETAAESLETIVRAHPGALCLGKVPESSEHMMKAMRKKYKEGVSSERAPSIVMPVELTADFFSNIKPQHFEALIELIRELPPALYPALFENIDLENLHSEGVLDPTSDSIYLTFIRTIQEDWFSPSQINALMPCLLANKEKLGVFEEPGRSGIPILIEGNQTSYAEAAYERLQAKAQGSRSVHELLLTPLDGRTVIERSMKHPRAFDCFFAKAVEAGEEQMLVTGLVGSHAQSMLLHEAATYPHAFTVCLSAFTKAERKELMDKRNRQGETPFSLACKRGDSLSQVLALYSPQENRARIHSHVFTADGNSVFFNAARSPSALKQLLDCLETDDERREQLERPNARGEPAVSNMFSESESLRLALALYPRYRDKTQLLSKTGKDGVRLCCELAEHAPALEVFLDSVQSNSSKVGFLCFHDNEEDGDKPPIMVALECAENFNSHPLQVIFSSLDEESQLRLFMPGAYEGLKEEEHQALTKRLARSIHNQPERFSPVISAYAIAQHTLNHQARLTKGETQLKDAFNKATDIPQVKAILLTYISKNSSKALSTKLLNTLVPGVRGDNRHKLRALKAQWPDIRPDAPTRSCTVS